MTPIHIHKNIKLLKHKLNKVEKIPEGRSRNKGVGFAVDFLPFNPLIPVLNEEHIKFYLKKQKEREEARKQEESKDIVKEKKDKKNKKKDEEKERDRSREQDHEQDKDKKKKKKKDKDKDKQKEKVREKEEEEKKEILEKKEREEKERQRQKEKAKKKREKKRREEEEEEKEAKKKQEDRVEKKKQEDEFDLSQILGELDSGEEVEPEKSVSEEPKSIFTSSIDTLVVREETDEFAHLKDDDSDEESTLTKNLRKIRSEKKAKNPPPPPTSIKPPFQTSNPLARQYPSNDTPPKKLIKSTHQELNLKEDPKKDEKKEEEELVAEDLEQLMKQKNWHIIYVELNRRVDAFKSNELARSVLKESVMTLLDIDDTFKLINYIRIVFQFEYVNDKEFWEKLIGKLKRKVSPHVQDHRFKCQADPMVVLNNYNIIMEEIYKHFTYSSVMRNAVVPWHLCNYLTLLCSDRKELVASRPPQAIASNPTAPIQTTIGGPLEPLAIENNDPERTFDVDILKTANGKSVFKIRSSRRNVEFNPRLFG